MVIYTPQVMEPAVSTWTNRPILTPHTLAVHENDRTWVAAHKSIGAEQIATCLERAFFIALAVAALVLMVVAYLKRRRRGQQQQQQQQREDSAAVKTNDSEEPLPRVTNSPSHATTANANE
jgi:heme exporter protein D